MYLIKQNFFLEENTFPFGTIEMPQIFQVLRCYKCSVFQVHQTKKSNKWECKMCGEKQSVKRHYGLGNAKECRFHVQKLNGIRGEFDELKSDKTDTDDEFVNDEPFIEPQINNESKWSNYVEEINSIPEDNNKPMYLDNSEVVLELPKKRKRGFGNHFNGKGTKRVAPNNYDKEIELSREEEPQCTTVTDYSYGLEQELPAESPKSPKHNINVTQQKIVNKFKPPLVNKNSKWAQFAEDEQEDSIGELGDIPKGSELYEEPEENEGLKNQTPPLIEQINDQICVGSKPIALFAMCDDSDLDTVLDL